MRKYPFSAYDKYLCLRPDFMLWLTFIFLLRPYVVTVLSIANRKDKTGLINMMFEDKSVMVLAALAAIPAAMVLYAYFKRKPEGSERVRKIWRYGRHLLAISTLLNLGIVYVPYLTGMVHEITLAGWIQSGICVLILFYLFAEERAIDTFADFPKQLDSD